MEEKFNSYVEREGTRKAEKKGGGGFGGALGTKSVERGEDIIKSGT